MVIEEVRRLEGWMTFQEAADALGYTKQGFHRLVFHSPFSPFNPDEDIRGVGDRPLMIIRTAAVEAARAKIQPADAVTRGQSRLIREAEEPTGE